MPGLGNGKDYIALGELSEEARVLRHGDSEDSDDEEEIVYCRDTDIDALDDLNLMKSNVSRMARPKVGLTDILSGLFNGDKAQTPSAFSSAIATVLTVIYSIISVFLALVLNHVDSLLSGSFFIVWELVIGMLVFCMTLCLMFLSLQPKSTQNLSFKVPLVPLVPGLSIFVNIYLMSKLSADTWVRFVVWMTIGLTIYFGYGIRNSSEEYKMKGQKPPEFNGDLQ